MDMVQLLIESGADLTYKPEELLYGSLRSQDLNLFSFLTDAGARIPAEQRDICRLFLHLADRHDPDVLPILDRLNMDLKQYGGEALRSMASHGNQLLAEYLVQKGTDINYHKPDMVFPYASTPVTEAARHNDFPWCAGLWSMVQTSPSRINMATGHIQWQCRTKTWKWPPI